MRGLGRSGIDLSKAQFIEFWINDFDTVGIRRGKLHIDFGTISEDFVWPATDSGLEYNTEQLEDFNRDAIFATQQEDVGLDAEIDLSAPEGPVVVREGEPYSAEEGTDEDPYPRINNTARNNFEDKEDLNDDTRFNRGSGYFSVTIDLAETEPLVDVWRDYPGEDLQGTTWRKYRIRLDKTGIEELSDGGAIADIAAVKHVRIWYEDPDPIGRPDLTRLQLSELQFLGSRWEREGIRKVQTEAILTGADLGPGESFFIGEINNKENPDYEPPFPVREEAGIPEKESALVIDFNELGPDHQIRIQKQVSASGDDYTRYETMSWYWHVDNPDVADLDLFFRFGADSTNYYEVSTRFIDQGIRTGWRRLQIDVAELTNLKTLEPDDDGVIRGEVADIVDGQAYQVAIRGRPDLRRVLRYYLGVSNRTNRTVTGEIRVNDVVLDGAKRDIGLAEKVGLRLNMADVLKVDFDWDKRDAEYHGLNEERGQGAVTENWSLSTNFRVDNFVPLFGFQLPVSLSRRSSSSRPKYEINSDVEILDEDRRNELSTLEERESFSVRLSRSPSRHFLPRYVLDPWTLQLSGSQSNRNSPTELSEQSSLQGSLNYNLQIQSDFGLGDLPGLGVVPLVGSLKLLPNRVAGGASFTSTDRTGIRRDLDGTEYAPTNTRTKPGTLNGDLEYRPLSIVTINYKNRSERDLLRRQEWNGINIGEQNRYSQDFTVNFIVPKATQMPQSAFYAPLRSLARGLNKLRPTLTYQGSYVNDTSPGVRQPGDPEDVHSVSNANDWQARAQLPAGEVFKDLFPERPKSDAAEQALAAEVQMVMQDARTDTSLAFKPTRVVGYEEMSREEQEEKEREWYREKAEERMLAEGRQLPKGGGGLSPRALVEPLLGALRGIEPIAVSYSRSRSSGYGRLQGADVGLDYFLGWNTEPDLPDSSFASRRNAQSENFSVSAKTRLTRDLQLDVKYTLATSNQRTNDTQSWNYSQDWPDLRLNLAGVERWGLFGGNPEDRNAGFFRSSSLDISYKHSKSVPNYTETIHNPRRSTTISPRWNMTFQSGMSVTLNGSLAKENQVSGGTTTDSRRFQVGLQLQHEIQAQAFLAKLGLYRPGNQPTMNVSVDLRYSRNTTDREVEGSNFAQATQGTQNIAVAPRFSYNITRNLTGAMSLNFNQTKNLATDLVNTTIGIGVEATFVF
jgi:cell surface protein SprA